MPQPVGGRDYPRNQPEFHKFFPSDRACLLYLAHLRWPEGFVCPSCGHDRYWLRRDGLYQCCSCRRKTSPTAGTIFDKTRFGLHTWFDAIWHVTSQKYGASALGLQRVLGFGSYETAWAWLHKLRRAMVIPGRDKLKGTVEVDETYFGGVKRGQGGGRGAPGKTMVVIATEVWGGNGAGRVRMQQIKHADKPTLHGFIQRNVEAGATVVTDGWWHYKGIDQLGYTHDRRVVHGSGKQAHDLLPVVHRVIALVKRWIEGTHQGSFKPEHLDYYLDEYTFRFNRKGSKSRGLLFYRLLRQAAQTAPQPYDTLLTAGARKRHRRKVQNAAAKRLGGNIGPVVTTPQRRPKRPGGKDNRLADPITRRRPTVKGRRGRR